MHRLPKFPLALFTCLALGLYGCRADQGKPDAGISAQISTTQPTPPPATWRPIIVCFGDSLTAGLGVEPGQSYPDYLQKLLDSNNFPYRVVNDGISGNTSKDAVDRVAHVISLHPQLVIVEFGGNDGLRGLPLDQTRKNIASVIDQLQTAHAKVALAGITLPPDYGADYITRFNAIYPALAKQYKVPYLPFLLKDVYGIPGSMQADGIHATDQGNKQVAANVAALIEPIIKH